VAVTGKIVLLSGSNTSFEGLLAATVIWAR
jgi:hypothetical protein